jgi:hypothetical protein
LNLRPLRPELYDHPRAHYEKDCIPRGYVDKVRAEFRVNRWTVGMFRRLWVFVGTDPGVDHSRGIAATSVGQSNWRAQRNLSNAPGHQHRSFDDSTCRTRSTSESFEFFDHTGQEFAVHSRRFRFLTVLGHSRASARFYSKGRSRCSLRNFLICISA